MVGVTAALTGPPASTYAPAVEALRIYLDRVNAAGGVNGKKIKLVIQDDLAQPSKAAANAKQLLIEDSPVLMLNASLSSTYAPVIAETENAGVPLMFASSVCPKDVYPPAKAGEFCTTAFATTMTAARRFPSSRKPPRSRSRSALSPWRSRLARRDRFRRQTGARLRHDRGRQGRSFHRRPRTTRPCDQDQRSGRQLGLFLGAVGDAGAHLRSAAPPRLVRRIRHLGASRGRRRAQAHQGSEALRHRRQCAVRGRTADPEGDRRRRHSRPAANIRRTR